MRPRRCGRLERGSAASSLPQSRGKERIEGVPATRAGMWGSNSLHPPRQDKEPQVFQRPARKAASPIRQRSNRPHTQQIPIAGEGSWYRPKQAMEVEPSGAGWAWRSDRFGRRGSEGPKVRRGRWRDSRVDGAGSPNRPVRGSVGVADGPFRATLILPARGETSIGMKQALNRRPSRQTVSRSGQVRSKRTTQTHGHPGWARSAPRLPIRSAVFRVRRRNPAPETRRNRRL